jgi:hypothetical protein
MMRAQGGAWSPVRWIVVSVLAASLAWNASALIRLTSSEGDVPAIPLVMQVPNAVASRPLDDPRVFSAAAARAPFDAPLAAAQVTAADVTPVAQPHLSGTVVQDVGSFVVLELTDGSIRVVRIGESAAGLTLRTVAPGVATFEDATGHRLVLRSAPTQTATRP